MHIAQNLQHRYNMRLEESKRKKRTLESLKDGTESSTTARNAIGTCNSGWAAPSTWSDWYAPQKPLEGEMVKKLIKEIENCGVQFNIWKNTTKYEFTSLTGTDRKKLHKQLPAKLIRCQPDSYASKVKLLWEVNIHKL